MQLLDFRKVTFSLLIQISSQNHTKTIKGTPNLWHFPKTTKRTKKEKYFISIILKSIGFQSCAINYQINPGRKMFFSHELARGLRSVVLLNEDFFDDLGIDWLLFFQEKTMKIKFGIFETLRGRIFNHIGSAQRRNFLYFPYYLPIRKYAWKMVQNWFFCKFSKTSEKTAYLQKKVCRNPPRR